MKRMKSEFRKKVAYLMTLVMMLGVLLSCPSTTVKAESNPNSKKGIQGIEFLGNADADELGVNHVLLNVDMAECIYTGADGYPVYYNGKPYYYNYYAIHYMDTVKMLNEKGIKVTMVLLMPWSEDATIKNLIYPGARKAGHAFYGLNVYDVTAREYIAALFDFLTSQYGSADCHVDNWIIGNEVNMPDAYNYTGTKDIATNVDICAESYLLLYNALAKNNPDGKAYISLDHSWTHNDEGRGIAGKTFLDKFHASINSKQAGVSWNLAYHPYPAIMDSTAHTYNSAVPYADTLLWNNRYTPNSVNADFVSTANIGVLTNYVRNNFGSDKRIILSELGYDARYNLENQAAATAYAYYAGQFDDMIDAVIFRAYKDDANDGSFKLGFKDASGNNRPSYDVFKYMDSELASIYANPYLTLIGVSNWNAVVPGYDYSVFEVEPESTDVYELRLAENGVWYCYKNGAPDTDSAPKIINFDGGKFLVSDGYLRSDIEGLQLVGSKWYFMAAGQVVTGYSGLALYDGHWFVVDKGVYNTNYNGLIDYNGGRFLVSGGQLRTDYSGLFLNTDGFWYFLSCGQVQNQYTGLAFYDNEWFYVENGVLAVNFTGWIAYDGAGFYVENGMVK